MNKITLHKYIALVAVSVLLCSCKPEQSHIYGEISGLPDADMFMSTSDGKGLIFSTSEECKFDFLLPKMSPDLLFIEPADQPGFSIPVINEIGDIHIKGSVDKHWEIEVTGTPANDALTSLRNRTRPLEAAISELKSGDAFGAEPEPNPIAIANRIIRRDSLENAINAIRNEFILDNGDNILSAMLLEKEARKCNSSEKIDSLLNLLSPGIPDNQFMNRMRERSASLKQ